MPITLLDAILVGFTLVSAMLAMVRGFSREVLSIVSWVASAAAAFFFYKPVVPYLKPYIDNDKIAMGAAAAIVFVIALIVVSVITMKIADWIIDSRVGALDRTLGFLYGAARGVLVVAVGLMFFTWLAGDKAPAWIGQSKSKPFLDSIGTWIEGVLPADAENAILQKLHPEQPAAPGTDTGSQDSGTDQGAAGDDSGTGGDNAGAADGDNTPAQPDQAPAQTDQAAPAGNN